MARIGIIGSEGRMGRALAEAVATAGEALSGGIDKGGDPAALAAMSDVLVDFSSPHALEANLDAAAAAGPACAPPASAAAAGCAIRGASASARPARAPVNRERGRSRGGCMRPWRGPSR